MTDTRLPEQWLLNQDLDKLSDTAWRIFTRALMYCNSQGTDGRVDHLYLRYVHLGEDDPTPYLDEIVRIGWMVRTESGYSIPDWEGKGQSTAAQMAEYREKNRLKAQRSRNRQKASKSVFATGDATSGATSDVGEARQQDRHGEASDMRVSWTAIEIPKKDNSVSPGGDAQ